MSHSPRMTNEQLAVLAAKPGYGIVDPAVVALAQRDGPAYEARVRAEDEHFGRAALATVRSQEAQVKKPIRQSGRGMNKLETAWAGVLEKRKQSGNIKFFRYERYRLRLGYDSRYTPDFFGQMADGQLVAWEVKGTWTRKFASRGMTALRDAATAFPEIRFLLCEKCGVHWKETLIPCLT